MTTQDLQSLKAELHDVEGELHRVAARIERIEQERASGRPDAARDAELSAAREDRRRFDSRRAELQEQIARLEETLKEY